MCGKMSSLKNVFTRLCNHHQTHLKDLKEKEKNVLSFEYRINKEGEEEEEEEREEEEEKKEE